MLPVSIRPRQCARRSIHGTLIGVAAWALLTPPTPASAQTVSIEPSVLQRIPEANIGEGRYYQQLRIVLEHDDAASPEAISIDLPIGVVVADTAGQGHTGTLTINADGTFSGDYQASGTTDTFEGTYEITSEDFMGAQTVVVEQTITLYNGSVPPKTPPLRLFFDPGRGILQDILTVAYARKGSEEEGSE